MTSFLDFKELGYDEIRYYTDNLSKERIISKFQFGTVYRGWNGEQELTVKIWNSDWIKGCCRVLEEMKLFVKTKVKGQPKPIGFCNDKSNPFAIVYDLKAKDTLHNLIPKCDFSWQDRIKVALGIALALESFHKGSFPFKIRNVSATHILCETDYTPRLYDFGMTTGGLVTHGIRFKFMGDRGYPGYTDPYYSKAADVKELRAMITKKSDVYAYGILLLGLITKRANAEVDNDPDSLVNLAEREYNAKKNNEAIMPSLVDECLKSELHFYSRDGRRITGLAMDCIKHEPDERPDMKVVVEKLRGLKVVQRYINEGGMNQALKKKKKK